MNADLSRMDRFCIGSASVLLVCSTGLGGVTITPVGPEGRGYFPVALNERGDVLFNATWAHPDGSNSGVQFSGPEAWFADGTSRRFPSAGADSGYSMALGDDGSVVARNAFLYPRSDGIDSLRFNSTVTSADGTDLPYAGASAFAFFETVTPDGRYLGFGSANEYLDDENTEPVPLRPIAWDPVHGEAVLQLPEGASGGMAYLWNPAGGSAGWTYSQSGSWAITWWNERGEVTGGFDTDSLAFPWPSVVGVRSDGTALGSAQGQLMEFHPDGTMAARGENSHRYDQALDANARGVILGESWEPVSHPSDVDVVLWMPDGQMLNLQTLFPPDSPWKLTDAVDITESGDVLVRAELFGDDGYAQAFIIRGIPAPGAVALTALGLAWAGIRRRR